MKLPKLTEGDLVEILWMDASRIQYDQTWIDLKDINWDEEELLVRAIQTVGYYLYKTQEYLHLCQTYCSQGSCINIFAIPIGCIRVLEKK